MLYVEITINNIVMNTFEILHFSIEGHKPIVQGS